MVIVEIKPQIFLFEFDNAYDLGMHFLRYQEYYESPFDEFRGKAFTIIDYMERYAKEYGNGVFSYPGDWGGFNLDGNLIGEVFELGIPDYNKYDREMLLAYESCKRKYEDFYIIGIVTGDQQTKEHELAHAYYALNFNYRKEMDRLMDNLPEKVFNEACNALKVNCYPEAVFNDELQAYLATGIPDFFQKKIKKYTKPFIKVFSDYNL